MGLQINQIKFKSCNSPVVVGGGQAASSKTGSKEEQVTFVKTSTHCSKQNQMAMEKMEREKKGGDGDWTSRIAVMVGALDLVEILLALFFVSVRGCSSNKKKCRTILVQ